MEPEAIRMLPLAEESFEEELERKSEREWLLRVVDELDPRSRVVIRMRFFEERSIADIAAHLGVSDSRASQICAAAVTRLRELLMPLQRAS